MDQLLDGELKTFGPEQFEIWGVQATDEFLKNGVPLKDTIKKMATENSLNPKQIARIAEVANNATFLALYKTSQDKTAEFPLADTREIVTELNLKASTDNPDRPAEFLQPLPSMTKKSSKVSKVFNDFLTMGDVTKEAAAPDEREKVSGEIDRLRQEIENSRDAYTTSIFKLTTLRKEAKNMMQNLILNEQASAPDLVDVMDETIPEQKATGMLLLQEVVDRLKKSAAATSENLFNRHPGVTVVNGSHPLFGIIQTIDLEENKGSKALVVGEMAEEKIRELKKSLVKSNL